MFVEYILCASPCSRCWDTWKSKVTKPLTLWGVEERDRKQCKQAVWSTSVRTKEKNKVGKGDRKGRRQSDSFRLGS